MGARSEVSTVGRVEALVYMTAVSVSVCIVPGTARMADHGCMYGTHVVCRGQGLSRGIVRCDLAVCISCSPLLGVIGPNVPFVYMGGMAVVMVMGDLTGVGLSHLVSLNTGNGH